MNLRTVIKKLKEEDHFWRIARTDTFIDILMLQYSKVLRTGLNEEIGVTIVETAIKAIINYNLDPIGIGSDYNQTMKDILNDKPNILSGIDSLLKRIQFEFNSDDNQDTFQMLQYFKVLSNLDLSNYDVSVFYNIIIAVLNSGVIATDANKA